VQLLECFVEVAAKVGPHRCGVMIGAALVVLVGEIRRRRITEIRHRTLLKIVLLGGLTAVLASVQKI
jgi:hypothetical protein